MRRIKKISSLKEVWISDSDAIKSLHFCFKFFRELFIIEETLANTIQKLQKTFPSKYNRRILHKENKKKYVESDDEAPRSNTCLTLTLTNDQ